MLILHTFITCSLTYNIHKLGISDFKRVIGCIYANIFRKFAREQDNNYLKAVIKEQSALQVRMKNYFVGYKTQK